MSDGGTCELFIVGRKGVKCHSAFGIGLTKPVQVISYKEKNVWSHGPIVREETLPWVSGRTSIAMIMEAKVEKEDI